MMLRKPARGAVTIGAATALMVGLAMGTALAATKTWTVKPGGKVVATSSKTTLIDTKLGSKFPLTCTQSGKTPASTATAKLKRGSHLSGKGIGKITSIKFNNCSVLTQPLTVQAGHLPWRLNAVSYKKGVTKGTITGIHAVVSVPTLNNCTMVVDGTSATANDGMVKATYNNKTHVLKILSGGGNLTIYNPVNCPIVQNGQGATFSGSYKLKKAEKITSP